MQASTAIDTGKGSYHPLLDVLSFLDDVVAHILPLLFFIGGVAKDEAEEGIKPSYRSSSNY
ncbi:hypothetical protein FKN90_04025 [Vibrio sp. 2017_1457_15]|nr:hypothetical protein [Vibrio sp. 2017_1457_15]MDQ2160393.1 hypothetical protein [Vibrio sp. 2017_1457_13]MDQ2189193.1 hypothetical protein [Vibrio sp. A14(2019)]NNN61016.1 hypothetical protein [Vibrio sp. A11]NNN83106.1 hypothetical protein [Vibrio sp. A8-1]